MALPQQLDEETQGIVDKIQKMLRLAGNNPDPEERARAEEKAFAWLAKFNLDMATVEAHGDIENGRRAEENLKGGYYEYQRDLWKAVAELNFCLYWNQMALLRERKFLPNPKMNGFRRHIVERYENQHRLVGRVHNIILTRNMAEYIEQAIERTVEEQCRGSDQQKRSKWANSLRRGIFEKVCERVYRKRRDQIKEQEQKARDAEIAAREAHKGDISTGRQITLSTLAQQEADANHDFLLGEDGASARMRAERAAERIAQAEARREAQAEYARWCAENPEEYAKQAKEDRARERKNAARRDRYWHEQGQYNQRGYSTATFKGDLGAYHAGRELGEKIGIDPQADRNRSKGAIG